MPNKSRISWSAKTERQAARTLVVAVAVVAAVVFARGTSGSTPASSSPSAAASSAATFSGGAARHYTLSLSDPTLAGPPVLIRPSDCRAVLGGARTATSLVEITIDGRSIKIESSNLTFRGTYDPSKRTFITSSPRVSHSSGVTEVAAFDGTFVSSGNIKGGYSFTALSPQASCVYVANATPLPTS